VDATSFFYTEFEFVSSQTGFACGGVPRGGTGMIPAVRKTTDGGATWTTVWTDSSRNFELEGISFAGEMNGWALSYDAYIFHTADGGNTWVLQDSIRPPGFPPPFFLPSRDIHFTTPDSGWVVGGFNGDMLTARTVDGGNTWMDTVMQGSSLREITMLNSQVGWIVGMTNAPFVLRTTNGGTTWEVQQTTPPSGGFESLSILNSNVGWGVGFDDVYKTTNGGVVSAEGDEFTIPSSFTLAQNYPNPFNPSTTIKYELPERALVTLTVYNVLGQNVVTLVSEEKEPGVHQVQFDGTGFASGLYFYRLKAGGFVETRKLVLLR